MKNNEEGYYLIVFNEPRAEEITARRARAREIHVLKANSEVVTLEKDGIRRCLLVYKGFQSFWKMGDFLLNL